MDRNGADFPQQSGLPSPYSSNFGGDAHSEASSSAQDQSGSAQAYPPPPTKEATYPAAATPASDYGVYPPPARNTSAYPDNIQRSFNTASSPPTGSMAQQPNSPSLPQSDGRNHQAQMANSDNQVPIDPSISAPSPTTYPYAQPSYATNPDMTHNYPHPAPSMYSQPRPEWGGPYHPQHGAPPLTPGHAVYSQAPASAPPQRPNQVYSFVPIPGAQQHKRPRRRYEEIERMYKCGWNNCEKAYGTLNHLNAHVTMQSHGQKRTPEEIRKEWKAKKKEEDTQRKADEERHRAQASGNGVGESHGASGSAYPGSRQPVQLPPIGYQPQYPAPGTSAVTQQQQPLPEYGASGHVYPNYGSHSPYGPGNMYNQGPNGGQPPH